MAFSDESKLATIKRVVAETGDFNGRTRRTDVAYFYLTICLIYGLVSRVGLIFPDGWKFLVSEALWLVLIVPIPALFVRRLHDQGRSGWFALVYAVPVSLALFMVAAILGVVPNVAPLIGRVALIQIAVSAVMVVIWMLPGTEGSNRYGHDPRQHEFDGVFE